MPNYFFDIGFVAVITIFAAIQFSTANVIGSDGNLHGYLTGLVIKNGFPAVLPNAVFSWFATRLCDKDFVFHLLSAPYVLTFGEQTGI
jgi:hypothetical protein